METSSLGESSGGCRRRVIHGRSDSITYGDPYQKAAALVDLAEDGIGLPEELLDQANFGTKAKYYFMFIRFDVLWTLNYFVMILLNFLEKLLWCFKYSSYPCRDRDYIFNEDKSPTSLLLSLLLMRLDHYHCLSNLIHRGKSHYHVLLNYVDHV